MRVKKIKHKINHFYRQQEEYWLGKKIIKNSVHASPDFIIIGVAKAGTTSLFQYLTQHPNIVPPSKKELNYFKKYAQSRGIRWYLHNFPLQKNLHNKLTFEASSYLYEDQSVERISHLLPETKFITIFRDPTERAYSNWNFYHDVSFSKNRTKYHDRRSFEDAVNEELTNGWKSIHPRHRYLYKGYYAKHLKHWYQYYSAENILILDFEELKNDPKYLLKRVTDFLSLDFIYDNFSETEKKLFGHRMKKDANNNKKIKQYNATPYKKSMSDEMEEKLRSLYASHNKSLKKLTGRTFSWMQ